MRFRENFDIDFERKSLSGSELLQRIFGFYSFNYNKLMPNVAVALD